MSKNVRRAAKKYSQKFTQNSIAGLNVTPVITRITCQKENDFIPISVSYAKKNLQQQGKIAGIAVKSVKKKNIYNDIYRCYLCTFFSRKNRQGIFVTFITKF